MTMTMRISHLCIIVVLIDKILSVPLCGTMDGSVREPSEDDKIYFPQGIRRVEINGTIVNCQPDGANMRRRSTTAPAYDEQTMQERIDSGKLSHSLMILLNEFANMIKIKAVFWTSTDSAEKPHRPTSLPTSDDPHTVAIRNRLRPHTLPAYQPNEVKNCITRNQTYCLNSTNYPEAQIEEMIRKDLHKYKDLFGSDGIEPDVVTRNNADSEEQLCDSYEEVIYPTAGIRQDETSWLIVNTKTYKQGVRVAKCHHANRPCRMTESFPNNYSTECKQHFVYRELLAISPEGTTTKDKFKFPACCSCVLHRI